MQSNESTKIGGEFHVLTTLEKGQRYTLLVQSEFLGAIAMQVTLEEVKVSGYAQYSESVQLIFKEKGKRKLSGIRFYGSKSCAVWQGWLEIDTNPFEAPTVSETGFLCRKSRYLSHDSRYMTDAIASVSLVPLFSKIN